MEFQGLILAICCIVGYYIELSVGKATFSPASVTTYPTLRYTRRGFWSKSDYPNPQTKEQLCHPDTPNARKSFICDPNEYLYEGGESYIGEMIKKLSVGAGCFCNGGKCNTGKPGLKLSVAMVSKINSGAPEVALKEFADYLRLNSWRFAGSCQDDMVLAISPAYGKAALSMGDDASKFASSQNINFDKILNVSPNIAINQEAMRIVRDIGKSLDVTVIESSHPNTNIVAGGGIDTWSIVAAVGVVVGFIALLALSAALAAYCGRKCRGSDEEQIRRKEARSQGQSAWRTFFGRPRQSEQRHSRSNNAQKTKQGRRSMFGRIGRKQGRDTGSRRRSEEYHNYHDVPEPIREESESRASYYNDRGSAEYENNKRASGSYRSDRNSRNSGYFESGGSQRGEPAHIF